MSDDLTARIERLESVEEIRQLVAKYCLALDVRDADSWVNLFPADVRVGRDETGRPALKRWFDSTMRDQFEGTAHVTGNHIIELIDGDHARGVVYSRNEHECGDEWVIMTMMYWDDYERIDRRWYFRRRLPLYWYATDLNKPPTGATRCAGRARTLRRGVGDVLADVPGVLGATTRRARRRSRRRPTRRVPHPRPQGSHGRPQHPCPLKRQCPPRYGDRRERWTGFPDHCAPGARGRRVLQRDVGVAHEVRVHARLPLLGPAVDRRGRGCRRVPPRWSPASRCPRR